MAITVVIAGPWLRPGYIFGTDFTGPRHFPLPDGPSSFALLQIALAALAALLPSEIVGKLLILAIIFCAALSPFQAAPEGFVARATASLVYVFNPFVYDRLSYGQLTVLAGYAVLPWVFMAVRGLVTAPSVRRATILALVSALIGVLDIHFLLIAAVMSACIAGAQALSRFRDRVYLAKLGTNLLVTTVLAFLASAYWFVPFLLGHTPEARTLSAIGTADLDAFSVSGDDRLGLVPNVLGLYGFWGESTDRYPILKGFVVLWPIALVLLLCLVAVGVVTVARAKNRPHTETPLAVLTGLGASAIVAAVLAIGTSESHIDHLIRAIDSVAPVYRGMRDSSKWMAVIALFYSQLVAIGVVTLMNWSREHIRAGPRREWLITVLTGIVFAVPLYYGNGLLYGMHGQVQPSSYPAGWYAADHALSADPHPGRTVFLPWHGYLELSFVHNVNRVVNTPAPDFFSVPVVASRDLEIADIPPPSDRDQVAVSQLVTDGAGGSWASTLASHDIKYVLLARELDWTDYAYLQRQSGLTLVGDYGSIVLYRNLSWTRGAKT